MKLLGVWDTTPLWVSIFVSYKAQGIIKTTVLQVGNLRLHVEILKVLTSCIFPPLCVCTVFLQLDTPSNSCCPRIVATQSVVSSPDPTCESGSGDLRLIPQASLLSGEKFLSANHIAENTICSATPEILGYFSMMTQHSFWAHKLVISF